MTNTNEDDRKLPANTVWLFALAALGVAIVLPKIVHLSGSVKTVAGIFALVYAAIGAASTIFARTGGLRAAGAFALSGVAHGAYWLIMMKKAAGAGAGTGTNTLIMTFTVVFALASVVGGIGGTLFGLKVRRNIAKTAQVLAQRSQR